MKVNELTGTDLDYWVAKAKRWTDYPDDSVERGKYWHLDSEPFGRILLKSCWIPTISWGQCGPLIEQFGITLYKENQGYSAMGDKMSDPQMEGDTPQEAICRAVVASVYGGGIVNEI